MTPADIILDARTVLSDRDAEGYRYEDADLLLYVNDAIKSCVTLRPEWFTTVGDYTCMAGQCEQSLDYEDAVALVQVLSHHGGNAILPFDVAAMDAFSPGWRGDTAGPATQWAKVGADPLRFYLYPKAPVAQNIDVSYIRRPAEYGMDDLITELPDILRPAFVDYVVGMAESRDDEHVVSQRAAQFMAQFASRVKG
jgi:hypothetical protein